MLQSNQNIFNQQVQQQRLSQCHFDGKLELQQNLSANKHVKKLNVVQLDLQNCQLPLLNQARPSWLQEQFQNLVQCQNKWQNDKHQLPQQRAQTSCHGDKENIQSFIHEAQPRSRTPFKMKESAGKYYEREVYSSLSKTRDTPHLNKKILELNIEKQNDQLEFKRRQNKRQSLEQHHSNNSHSDIKKEKNKYNNFLGQYHVQQQSASSCNTSSHLNKNIQQNQDKTPQKLSQAEIAQMTFQNSFLNIKQILSKNSAATFNTEENEVIKTEEKEQQEYQKIKLNKQHSSKESSLASLNSSVPLNSILKGDLNLFSQNGQQNCQQYNSTYITNLLTPISNCCSKNIKTNQQKPQIVLLTEETQQEKQEIKNQDKELSQSEKQQKFEEEQQHCQQNASGLQKDLSSKSSKIVKIEIINNSQQINNIQKRNNSQQINSEEQINEKVTDQNAVDGNQFNNENDQLQLVENQNNQNQEQCRLTSENERLAKVFNNYEIQQRIRKVRHNKLKNNPNDVQNTYYNVNVSTDDYVNTKQDEDIIMQNLSLFENHVLDNDRIEINLDQLKNKNFGINTMDSFRKDKMTTARSSNANVVNVNLIQNPNYNKQKNKQIQPNILKGKKLTLKQFVEKNQKLKKQTPHFLLKNDIQIKNVQETLNLTQKNGFLLYDIGNLTQKSEVDNNDALSVHRIDIHSADSQNNKSQRFYHGSHIRGKIASLSQSKAIYNSIDDDNSIYARNAYESHTNEMIKTNASIYVSQLICKTQEEIQIDSKPKIFIQEQSTKNSKEQLLKTSEQQYQLNDVIKPVKEKRRRKSVYTELTTKLDQSLCDGSDEQLNKTFDHQRRKSLIVGYNRQNTISNQTSLEENNPFNLNKKTGRKMILSTLNYKELRQNNERYHNEDLTIIEKEQKLEQNSPEKSLEASYMNQILHSKKTQKNRNENPLIQLNKIKQSHSNQNSANNQKKAVSLSLYYIAGNQNNDMLISNKLTQIDRKNVPISLYQQLSNQQKNQQKQNTHTNNFYQQSIDIKPASINQYQK
ncbi:hypothetical protein TTHERM_00321750 (macronuclear) [Tetrahymena thermophila SB210]|uniref:Uncharacterized protein n=1 Tax=Tetrahymena thermophila (strain SB210) TaxID=312017 RepID=Q237L1_TETTS|nr:hypothetical protein TTHERM_00321750 [Tetrahymena thermophila SB210]EAR92730.3 hypothetical protein TTHERM_00321750 [Tetrahymena thermophila SB210]|eukprot:XP_001012975.3 hypothetical protein TTHERM_00321750 [Tetrahymena thermophila SB210]